MAFNGEPHAVIRSHDSGSNAVPDAVPDLVRSSISFRGDDYSTFLPPLLNFDASLDGQSPIDSPTHDASINGSLECCFHRYKGVDRDFTRNVNGPSRSTQQSLFELIIEAMEEGGSLAGEKSRFLSASSLESIVTPRAVEAALLQTSPISVRFVDLVLKDFKKVFAILTMASKSTVISNFVAHGVTDRCLPIPHDVLDDAVATPHDQRDRLLCLFRNLDKKTAASFLKWQYIISPPQMLLAYPGAIPEGVHQSFHERTVLPLTRVEQSRSGGQGTIFRVRIHPDHDRGAHLQASEKASRFIAVKRLRTQNDFTRELDVLRKVSRNPHPNIVPFLGSFQLGRDFYLAFPWADGDLSTFWRQNPKPNMDVKLGAWAVKQIAALVDALAFLHGLRSPSNEAVAGKVEPMVHGDLKPENILYFQKAESHESPVLVISDLGSAATYQKIVPPDEMPRSTPVYRAPEGDLKPCGISPAADIWSLGCVMLEAITWMMYGSAGLDGLAASRRDIRSDDPSRDAFFCYVENSTGHHEALLKPGVVDWTSAIALASDFSKDFINLIREDMLVFVKGDDMYGRLTSLMLRGSLSKIHQNIERNAAYCERRGPLQMAPPSLSIDRGQGTNRKRAWVAEAPVTANNGAKRKKTDKTDMNDEFFQQTVPTRRFACPYWKAHIDKSFLNRACEGPGWAEVHRVKEHIKRCHIPSSFKNPHVCGRCLGNFGSQERLVHHQREETQCIIRAPEIMDGKLTLEQVINLRSTRKKAPNMTDEEKWFEWFSILLPTYPLPSCPYHEDEISSTLNTLSTQNSTGISEYKEYLRMPLDDEKQKALEDDLGEALGISNPAICKILAAKFRDYQLRDLQKFDDDKLKPMYKIPAPDDLPAVGKGHDNVGAGFESYLPEWTGMDGEWPVLGFEG